MFIIRAPTVLALATILVIFHLTPDKNNVHCITLYQWTILNEVIIFPLPLAAFTFSQLEVGCKWRLVGLHQEQMTLGNRSQQKLHSHAQLVHSLTKTDRRSGGFA